VRNVIHVRKAHPVFGMGSLAVQQTSNESVLAFVRSWAGSGTDQQFGPSAEDVLCVFSFAHNPTSVTISAPGYAGRPLVDLFGGGSFPPFDADGNVTLTLGTQAFYWLHVGQGAANESAPRGAVGAVG
jgi:maltose alpha-D-glucosyltransferase/alpha-amylase